MQSTGYLGGTLALHRNHRLCHQTGPFVLETWPCPICYTVHLKFILEGFLPEKSVYQSCASPGYRDLYCYFLSSWEQLKNVIWAGVGLSLPRHIITLKCRFIYSKLYVYFLTPRAPLFHRYIHKMSCRKYKLLIIQALSFFLNLSKGLFVKYTQMPFDRWGANCSVNYLYRFLFHVEPNKQKILMLWKKWMMTFLGKHSLRSLIIGDSWEQRSIAIAVALWSL